MSQTCGQKRFTIEVVTELMVCMQHIMQPSIAYANEQLDPQYSQ